jgi:hypothetical protein
MLQVIDKEFDVERSQRRDKGALGLRQARRPAPACHYVRHDDRFCALSKTDVLWPPAVPITVRTERRNGTDRKLQNNSNMNNQYQKITSRNERASTGGRKAHSVLSQQPLHWQAEAAYQLLGPRIHVPVEHRHVQRALLVACVLSRKARVRLRALAMESFLSYLWFCVALLSVVACSLGSRAPIPALGVCDWGLRSGSGG